MKEQDKLFAGVLCLKRTKSTKDLAQSHRFYALAHWLNLVPGDVGRGGGGEITNGGKIECTMNGFLRMEKKRRFRLE